MNISPTYIRTVVLPHYRVVFPGKPTHRSRGASAGGGKPPSFFPVSQLRLSQQHLAVAIWGGASGNPQADRTARRQRCNGRFPEQGGGNRSEGWRWWCHKEAAGGKKRRTSSGRRSQRYSGGSGTRTKVRNPNLFTPRQEEAM